MGSREGMSGRLRSLTRRLSLSWKNNRNSIKEDRARSAALRSAALASTSTNEEKKVWKLQHKLRTVRTRIHEIEVEEKNLCEGNIPQDLLETPRPKHRTEESKRWTVAQKMQMRTDMRRKRAHDLKEKRLKLIGKRENIERRIRSFSAANLPPLHSRLLRNDVVDIKDMKALQAQIHPPTGDPNIKSVSGWRPIHIAVIQSQLHVIRILAEAQGFNIDAKDDAGCTALHYALMFGNLEIAYLLYAQGADPTMLNRSEQTPMQAGKATGHHELVGAFEDSINLSTWAKLKAARFYNQLFEGKPDHYHYMGTFFESGRLLAYALLVMPKKTMSLHRLHALDLEDLGDPEALGKFLFKKKPREKWQKTISNWEYASPNLFKKICSVIFGGKMNTEQLEYSFLGGRALFERWQDSNSEMLKEEEAKTAINRADAIRLKRLEESVKLKKKLEEEEASRLAAIEAKKGHPLDPNAGITMSAEFIFFATDSANTPTYTVVLNSEPHGSVLVKIMVQTADGKKDKTRIVAKPKLLTFAPENWDEPQTVTVEPIDDDNLVRLRRSLVNDDSADHQIVHEMQFSTDRSYKHPDLKWNPSNIVPIKVTE